MKFGQVVRGVPPHVWLTGSVTPTVTAVSRRIRATATGCPLSSGFALITSAAAPATCGVAMLVPSRFVYEFGGHEDGTLTPGADASGFMFEAPGRMLGRPSTGPRLEKPASASLESVAPTVNEASN